MSGKTFSIAEQDLVIPDTKLRLRFRADPVDYSNSILRIYGEDGRYLEAIFNRNGLLVGEPHMVDPAAIAAEKAKAEADAADAAKVKEEAKNG